MGMENESIGELVERALSADTPTNERVVAMGQLWDVGDDDYPSTLAALMQIATNFGETHEPAFAAGAAIAAMRVRRGIIDNLLFADFSDAAFEGYNHTAADLQS